MAAHQSEDTQNAGRYVFQIPRLRLLSISVCTLHSRKKQKTIFLQLREPCALSANKFVFLPVRIYFQTLPISSTLFPAENNAPLSELNGTKKQIISLAQPPANKHPRSKNICAGPISCTEIILRGQRKCVSPSRKRRYNASSFDILIQMKTIPAEIPRGDISSFAQMDSKKNERILFLPPRTVYIYMAVSINLPRLVCTSQEGVCALTCELDFP